MGIEKILKHGQKPHNFGVIEGYTHKHKEVGSRCGDIVEIFVKLDGNKITDISFISESCAICTASASLLTDYAKGKKVEKIRKMDNLALLKIMKIKLHADKLKCAMVPLDALKKCVR
ncbi:MAG: iron-sulfur cluster assembly scaffold protein [Candidatus Aenigmatarchaeota archaeon]